MKKKSFYYFFFFLFLIRIQMKYMIQSLRLLMKNERVLKRKDSLFEKSGESFQYYDRDYDRIFSSNPQKKIYDI
ncbi:hypothetical protein EE074_29660 [Klebsiella pneumoniae]|nr:hypothetical protein [Klebsiella pneumoniae]